MIARVHYLGLGLGAAMVLLSVTGARAGEGAVAPLTPSMEPPLSEELTHRFHDALASGLRAGGLEVQPLEAVQAALPATTGGCSEGDCVTRAGAALGAARTATLQVNTVGKNYAIAVRVFSGAQLVTKVDDRCDICTMAEALQTVERAATTAAGQLKTAAAALPAEPAAGAPQGTPTQPPQDTGAQADEPGAMSTAPPPPPAEARRVWPLWPGIVAGGAGLTALAIGIPLVAIDGDGTNCRGEARSDFRNCEDLYDTAAGGWVLTTMGLAGLAASGVLFYLHFTSQPDEKASARRAGLEWINAAPLPEGGVAVGALGRF